MIIPRALDPTYAGVHAPSFQTGSPEEKDVCKGLIQDPEGLRDFQNLRAT